MRRVGATGSRRVNVRLMAATHRDLRQMSYDGQFRNDLYFRLRVVEISLPPLRARGADVLELADFLLSKTCRRLNKPPLELTPEARQAIFEHPWPGNVRELENAIERAVILSDGGQLTPDLLAIDGPRPGAPPGIEGDDGGGSGALTEYFRRFVLEHQGHLSETEIARRLGISPQGALGEAGAPGNSRGASCRRDAERPGAAPLRSVTPCSGTTRQGRAKSARERERRAGVWLACRGRFPP